MFFLTGSFSSMSTEVETCEQSDEDTLNLLETMTERLKYGSNIASRILMCYRISLNVGKPYKTIIKCTDSHTLLRQALDADCTNKLDVVSDIFTIYKWTKKEVSCIVEIKAENILIKRNYYFRSPVLFATKSKTQSTSLFNKTLILLPCGI